MKWLRPATNGDSPCPRCAHTTEYSGKLFIYGGWDGTRMLGDLFILHPDTMTWSKPITTGPEPRSRAGHTCTAVGTKLMIWGGGDGTDYLNDLHILDTETMSWCRAYSTGTPPSARSRHSATIIADNQILYLGGGGDTCVYNDAYILHTDTMSWSKPNVKGTAPTARWGHTATLVDGKVYVYGGHDGKVMLNDLIVLDVAAMRWEKPRCKGSSNGERPPPLAGHTATLLKIAGKNCILYFGGGDGNEIFKDAYLLDLQTYQWTKPQMAGGLPAARCAHTANLIGDKLLVFGGGDGSRRFKDIYLLDLRELIGESVPICNGNNKKIRDSLLRQNVVSPNQRNNNRKQQQTKYNRQARFSFSSSTNGTPQTSPRINTSSSPSPTNSPSPSVRSSMILSPPPPPPPSFNSKCLVPVSSPSTSPRNQNPPSTSQRISPTTNPVALWLSSIGMGQYIDNFLKEDVDMELLPHLTEMHLHRLGVTTLGARLRILTHIKALNNDPKKQTSDTSDDEPSSNPQVTQPNLPSSTSNPLSKSNGSKSSNPTSSNSPNSSNHQISPNIQLQEEISQLRRELSTRTSELARMETLVQHFLSVMRAPPGAVPISYGYGLVPPPPPPPTMQRHMSRHPNSPPQMTSTLPPMVNQTLRKYLPSREGTEELKSNVNVG